MLKVVAPSSHTALSGDVTVFILNSAETESSTISTNIVATNGTNGMKKDEEDKIDPEKNEINGSHEPLVLRYVEKPFNEHAQRPEIFRNLHTHLNKCEH